MQYVKLQVGCLFLICYVIVMYCKEKAKVKTKTHKIFESLLIVAPLAVIADGATAWTVNHLDSIPVAVNHSLHLAFFLLMDIAIFITSVYMYEITIGFQKKRKLYNALLATPAVASIVLVIATLPKVYYVEGNYTNYSMGIPVYICYASLVIHYGYILYLLVKRQHFLPKDKKVGIFFFIIANGVFLVAQMIFPEILVTAVFPTLLVIGIYINFEDPFLQKLVYFNGKMVEGFANLVESRDESTGGHIKRTKGYVDILLQQMTQSDRYQHILSKDYIKYVSNGAPMHDIGKISIPDSILQKPGKLTEEEFATMKQHTVYGGEIIQNLFEEMEEDDFQKIAYEMARYHHEKYNGKGYPEGIAGEEIPLHARIMAISDVFDAVSQNRCYREAMPLEKCFSIIEQGAGTDFDPYLVKLFMEAREQVEALCMQERNS